MSASFSRGDKLACLDRELRLRRRVYPTWVAKGRMTQAAADREIALMEAVRSDLERLLPDDSPQRDLWPTSKPTR